MIIEELKLPFTVKFLEGQEMKSEPYVSLNPNGRMPAIEDPNTGMKLWESCAIIEYLVDTYDKENSISFTAGSKEFYEAKQWLFYQASGQGPYFGQAMWFNFFHAEKLPSAVDRYINEIRRVSTVLETVLKNKKFLVGGKYSYVDTSFLPWYLIISQRFADRLNFETEFPNLHAWLERTKARPAVMKATKDREANMKAT